MMWIWVIIYGPCLGPEYDTAPSVSGIQKGTIILKTTHIHMYFYIHMIWFLHLLETGCRGANLLSNLGYLLQLRAFGSAGFCITLRAALTSLQAGGALS